MCHLPRTSPFRWSAVAIVLAMMAALVTTPASAAPVPGVSAALQFNGTNQWVDFGQAASTAAPGLGATDFTLETWFNWTGGGTAGGTGNLGLTNSIPLIAKGGAQTETSA